MSETKLVPVEPTQKMIMDGHEALIRAPATHLFIKDIWKAMLAAAPQPEQAPVAEMPLTEDEINILHWEERANPALYRQAIAAITMRDQLAQAMRELSLSRHARDTAMLGWESSRQHAETAERELAQAQSELRIEHACNISQAGNNPFCGHPSYLTQAKDSIGADLFCWQCRAEATERELAECRRQLDNAIDTLAADNSMRDELAAKLARFAEAEKKLPEEPPGWEFRLTPWTDINEWIRLLRAYAIAATARADALQVEKDALIYKLAAP